MHGGWGFRGNLSDKCRRGSRGTGFVHVIHQWFANPEAKFKLKSWIGISKEQFKHPTVGHLTRVDPSWDSVPALVELLNIIHQPIGLKDPVLPAFNHWLPKQTIWIMYNVHFCNAPLYYKVSGPALKSLQFSNALRGKIHKSIWFSHFLVSWVL